MDPLVLILQLIVLLFSVVIHEVSHGLMALRLGDPTAKYMGRLTLNPIKHLDLFGSFIFPLIVFIGSGGAMLFGWAKPVPYNPYNLRNQKWGPALVALAGPVSNLLVAAIFAIAVRYLNLVSGNMSYEQAVALAGVFTMIVIINVLLAIFNLVPIPPLDGSKILFAALPYRYEEFKVRFEQYGFVLLLLFIFFGFSIIIPIVDWISRFLIGA